MFRNAFLLTVLMTVVDAAAATEAVMRQSDVVFMYGADESLMKAYGANWAAWGGPDGPRQEGVHTTGSFWCLTARARLLHENAVLRDAVAKDIEGNPILVPWQLDHTYEGTPTWFGCTNHPDFRKHLDELCREAISTEPDGLHIDDPAGTYAPASYGGGCFCGHCMKAFREYLIEHDSDQLRKEAGVEDFSDFNYRDLVGRRASTKDEYFSVQNSLPLRRAFLDFNLEACVDNIRRLRELAREKLGKNMTLSVNTWYGGPGGDNLAFHPVITHMVAEILHHASEGTGKLDSVVTAYRQAETIQRPLASTGGGEDWAYVKENGAVNLVKIWIALGYACGQRFMVPHPKKQWCHTKEKGTHWYAAPKEEFAPYYRFVRENASLLDGFRTVGPLAPPKGAPRRFDTREARARLKRALEEDFAGPLKAGKSVWVFPRRKGRKLAVAHLVNTDYDPETDTVRSKSGLEVRIPAELTPRRYKKAVLYAVGSEPNDVATRSENGELVIEIPSLDTWGLVELRR